MNRVFSPPVFMLACTVVMLLALGALAEFDGPHLVFSARPDHGFLPLTVHLRADIKGQITDEWECPTIVWTRDDGCVYPPVVARHAQDCNAADWEPETRRETLTEVCRASGVVVYVASLYQGGRLLATKSAEVRILQGVSN